MELHELMNLRLKIEGVLTGMSGGSDVRVSIEYPDSPNSLCFFEVDCAIFAQGSFWSSYEFCVEALCTVSGKEIMNEHGEFKTEEEALPYVRELCNRANGQKYFLVK